MMAQDLKRALGRLPATRQELENTLSQMAKIREEIIEKQILFDGIYSMNTINKLRQDLDNTQDQVRFLQCQVNTLTGTIRMLQNRMDETRVQSRTEN